jgi:hypothetical protein
MGAAVGRIRRAAARAEAAALSDGQLLTRFVTDRDEAAFAELVASEPYRAAEALR